MAADACAAMTSTDQALDRMLRAIADPRRRQILQALKEKGGCSLDKEVGLCACDIEERLNLSQSTISHHMSTLCKAGLVRAQKQGQWMWYQRNESGLRELTRMLRSTL